MFKVGDKVIALDNNIGYKEDENRIGTIISIVSSYSYPYRIKFKHNERLILYCKNVKPISKLVKLLFGVE